MSTDKSARHYIEVISTRPQKPIEIVDYDPSWPTAFVSIAQRIKSALGARALTINHVGSTSIPGLAAKAIIDVDLVVPDPTAEDEYVPALEAAGFQFLFREPNWYEHRFFGLAEPYANVHVFGPGAGELSRHQRFRDWLVSHPEDRELYVRAKRESARESRENGESVQGYNFRKEGLLRRLWCARGFRCQGLISLSACHC
ncbi:GrpB family protein [Aspergillus novofumigatus IBT 16806]|uniref:GrpB domain protein n=1 Tax=Aspergillus novofumigatus (strain IBT 16806) TaxID=1392255 RepID=A0A2I1BWS2_ASPN1|nr:GrpB domain protein [Aspergillus novofumigatus IBT 16806]PKX89833.1 GrpB domain protein [Aspergillus novofumigatus IBT 16806]